MLSLYSNLLLCGEELKKGDFVFKSMKRISAPPYNLAWVRQQYLRFEAEEYWRNWVDELEIRNSEKVLGLSGENQPPYLYLANHQSFLDYFVPVYAILKSELPHPRCLAGSNLNNAIFRNLVWNFSNWGVIWTPREKVGEEFNYGEMKNYSHSLDLEFRNGKSVLGFAEGARNRNPERDLLDFKFPLFRIIARIQQDLIKSEIQEERKRIKAVYIAARYENIPEKNYWERIDKSGKKDLSYYFWDIYSYLRWRHLEKKKGKAVVAFSEPFPISDMCRTGSIRKKAENLSDFSRKKIKELLAEIS